MLGDYERTTSVARYYTAARVGGSPKLAGWESQSVRLVPVDDLPKALNIGVDKAIAGDIAVMLTPPPSPVGKARSLAERIAHLRASIASVLIKAKGGKGGDPNQPHWPKGTPLGGQWKSMDGVTGLTMPPKIGSAANPAYTKKADALYAAALMGDTGMLQTAVANLGQKVADFQARGATHSNAKWTAQLHQYGQELLTQSGAKAAVGAAPTLGVASTKTAGAGPLKLSEMTFVKPKGKGSADGAFCKDADGNEWLVKGYGKADMARNEVLASHLYKAAGIDAPEMRLIDLGGAHKGGLGIASRVLPEKFADVDPKLPPHLAAAQKGFAVDAWLANWDTVGLTNDNLVITASGKAVRIDPGGALLYRAQGQPKGAAFGTQVVELDSLRSKAMNPQAAAVFGGMAASQIADSAKRVAGVDDATIKALVDRYGPGTKAEKAASPTS